MGIAAFILCAAGGLVRPLGEARVDWESAVVFAEGGAPADTRLPTPDMARPGAERRARAAAAVKLRGALVLLPLGGGRKLDAASIDRALARAKADVDYQSNGGALVRLEVRFGDWLQAAPGSKDEPGAKLSVRAMPLVAAPQLVGREDGVVWARYRSGAAPSGARRAKVDGQGRLSVDGKDPLAGRPVVIWVESIEGDKP